MNQANTLRFELDPKITESEIEAQTHDKDAHVGQSTHFADLLKFLVALGAFGPNVNAPRVADLIYAPSSWLSPTQSQERAGKSDTHWGHRRFEKLRYGKASFTQREAQYFHDAFRRILGNAWADQITAQTLIHQPLHQTLSQLQQSGLPGPWEKLDPVSTLRLLNATQSNTDTYPRIQICPHSAVRISSQGDLSDQDITEINHLTTLAPGTEYTLSIQTTDDKQNLLVLELANHPMLIHGQPIQGQRLSHQTTSGNTSEITGASGQPLKVLDTPGEFAFLCIAYPKDWDVPEAFGIPSTSLLDTEALQVLVQHLRKKLFKGSDVRLGIEGYWVVKG